MNSCTIHIENTTSFKAVHICMLNFHVKWLWLWSQLQKMHMQIRHIKTSTFVCDGHEIYQSLVHFQYLCIDLCVRFFFYDIKFIYQKRKKGLNKIKSIRRHVVKSNVNNLTLLLQIINTLQQELSSKYQASFREICHFTAFITHTTLKSSHVPEILQGSRRM